MKVIFFYMFINNKFIKNSEYPICKNCFYYLKDSEFPNDHLLAKCTLFGEQDIISGAITNYYVDRVRNNNKLCGIDGKFFNNVVDIN